MSAVINPKPGSIEWLQNLKKAANEVLAEAVELHRVKGLDTPFKADCVNWADLSCCSAYWYVDDEAMEGPFINVSEASPGGAYFLCLWVSERLAERGFDGVSVKTEW